MKKRLLAAMMAAAMLLTGCSNGGNSGSDSADNSSAANTDVKVGFVYIGSINDGGYTQAHDKGRLAIEEQLGVETAYIENVEENVSAVTEAIGTLIDEKGCNLIKSEAKRS